MCESKFVSCVKRNNRRIYLIALSYTKSSADAEDIMQNVFVKLWKYEKPFENDEHIDKWLTVVTINESRDYIKNPFKRYKLPLEEAINLAAPNKNENIDLLKAVMELPKKERTVIHLFYYEDMPVSDISQILKIKESAVKTRLFRARKKLKSMLGDEWIYE